MGEDGGKKRLLEMNVARPTLALVGCKVVLWRMRINLCNVSVRNCRASYTYMV